MGGRPVPDHRANSHPSTGPSQSHLLPQTHSVLPGIVCVFLSCCGQPVLIHLFSLILSLPEGLEWNTCLKEVTDFHLLLYFKVFLLLNSNVRVIQTLKGSREVREEFLNTNFFPKFLGILFWSVPKDNLPLVII